MALQELDKVNSEPTIKLQKECVFKRGGMCVNHGVMDRKLTEKHNHGGKRRPVWMEVWEQN